eukprot:COSAG06_NODE_654_length_13350_cov_72.384499_4_plen_309_part_00
MSEMGFNRLIRLCARPRGACLAGLPGWSGLATTTLASPMLAYARLEAITSTAPPLSGEARTLLAAQCFPSAGVLAAPVAAVCSALGVPAERTAAPAPEARLPLRLLRPEPTEQERTLWKECSVLGLHEIFSMEFLDALSSAVSELLPPPAPVAAGGSSSDQLPVVLEIGAGSGSLSHQLGQRLRRRARVAATDDHSSRIETVISVAPLACSAALAEHEPAVVLVSWMPAGVDWTAEIRACPSVCAYLLVGEADGDNCGDSWSTWVTKRRSCRIWVCASKQASARTPTCTTQTLIYHATARPGMSQQLT